MSSIQKDMINLREQLRTGSIQKAYRALLDYMMALRTHFMRKYPNYSISGLYQGYMDMSYFAIVPPSLKPHDMKIAVVFKYEKFRFEVWLSARNRQVQKKYWKLFKDSQWTQYRTMTPAKGVDSIVESNLSENFDFGDLDRLTVNIEEKTVEFIHNIERFLFDHEIGSKG